MRMKGYEYYLDEKKGVQYNTWEPRGGKTLTEYEQVLMAQTILVSIGMSSVDKKRFSTFDTIMSWNGDDYYGLTEIDRLCLQGLWGASAA